MAPISKATLAEVYAASEAKRKTLEAQADAIAALLGLQPDEIMFDSRGICLSVSQGAALIEIVTPVPAKVDPRALAICSCGWIGRSQANRILAERDGEDHVMYMGPIDEVRHEITTQGGLW